MNDKDRDEAFAKMANQVNDIHGDMKLFRSDLKRHDKTLYGAERPGLVERFQSVEEFQRSCPAAQKERLGVATARKSNRIAIITGLVFVALNITTIIIAVIALKK